MKKTYIIIVAALIVGLLAGFWVGSVVTTDKFTVGKDLKLYEPENTEYDPQYAIENTDVNFEVKYNRYKGEINPYVNTDEYRSIEVQYTSEFVRKWENSPWEIFYKDVVKNSVAAFSGEFYGFRSDGEYGYWEFAVTEVLYGDLPDSFLVVKQKLKNAYYTAFRFESGNEYLITLSSFKQTDSNGINLYHYEGGLLIDLTEMADFQWHNGDILVSPDMNRDNFLKYYKSFAENYGYKK